MPPISGKANEAATPAKTYFQFILAIGLLNAVSTILFLALVNKPVYDDPYNMLDVHAYATQGVSLETIRRQRNPPGPVAFVWMATAVRALGGDELRDARIASLLSWLVLAGGVLLGARFARHPDAWYAALLATLVFPHTPTATATALTEGPALLFALLGTLFWTESLSQPVEDWTSIAAVLTGGLLIGLAAVSRQYFLALLPAAFLFALFFAFKEQPKNRFLWGITVIASLALASLPVLLLMGIWKGLSSPGMATGTSYPNWKATVGVNLLRPVVTSFYCAFYLLLFTFPLMNHIRGKTRWFAVLLALAGGILAARAPIHLLQPGPLHSLVQAARITPHGRELFLGTIVSVTIYNAIACALFLWEKRNSVLGSPLLLYSLLVVLFFILEQIGVGGNLPFYDRYMLQLAPFLGILSFSALPRLTAPRTATLCLLSVLGQIMLWRYAFMT